MLCGLHSQHLTQATPFFHSRWHQLPEALQERVDLGPDGGGHAVARDEVHVLALVGLRHADVLAACGTRELDT